MKYALILLSFILFGCATSDRNGQQVHLDQLFDHYNFPETVLSYELSHQINYERETPGEGIGRTYAHPKHGAITIYIYDRGKSGIGSGADSELVVREFFETTIPLQLNGQNIETMEKDISKPQIVERNGVGFWKAEWKRIVSGRKATHYLFLTGNRGKFLKVRVTLFDSEVSNREIEVQNILDEITQDMILQTQPFAGGDATR